MGLNGPQLTGIQESATVAEGYSSAGWILPSHRTRNPTLAELRTVLLNTATPNETDGPDSYTWFVAGSTSNVFSTKQTWENLRPRETAKQWAAAVW